MILDAYAVVSLLRDEPSATEVARLVSRGDASLTVLGLAEVLDHLTRVAGMDEREAALDVFELKLDNTVPLDAQIATDAGLLRGRRYHRTRCAISMADCVAAASARRLDRPLVTSDPHLLDACRAESIPVHVLPGSDGTVWTP